MSDIRMTDGNDAPRRRAGDSGRFYPEDRRITPVYSASRKGDTGRTRVSAGDSGRIGGASNHGQYVRRDTGSIPDQNTVSYRPRQGGGNGTHARAHTAPRQLKQDLRGRGRDRARRGGGFDLYLEGRGRRLTATPADLGVMILLVAAIITLTVLAVRQRSAYRSFLEMKHVVDHQGFYEGTTVEGIDLTGMTLEDALTYWRENIEPAWSQRAVSLSTGEYYSAEELGYTSDYEIVLGNAWNAGRSGTLADRYRSLLAREGVVNAYSVTRSICSQERVMEVIGGIAETVDHPPSDAVLLGFDLESHTFQFQESTEGVVIDREELAGRITATLNAGGGDVEVPVTVSQPSLSTEALSAQYGMISSAVTNASSSNRNRISNITTALASIDGTCLKPGEKFSFNAVVGRRTEENGYQLAHAYAAGEVVDEVGGGICQVSTTLFNAAVKADLKVTERHNHSMTVAYVDKGKDAAVSWPNQDLVFVNTSSEPIYICCYVDSRKLIRVGIFGRLLENGESITLEAVTTGMTPYGTDYVVNADLAPGAEKRTRTGKDGYTAEAYKIRWDADGNEIERTLQCKSNYPAINEIIEYNPG